MRGGVYAACVATLLGGAAVARAEAGDVNWPGYNNLYDGQRFSPLTGITAANAGTLAESCRVQLARGGAGQSGPVFIDGTIYVTTATETFAIAPGNCAIRWKNSYAMRQAPVFPVNRGVAYLNGRLFRGTPDGRLLAIDAKTGATLWEDVAGDPAVGEFTAGVPVAWNGLVITAIAGSDWGARGRVMAFDAATGREVWRFNTVPAPGERGAETWTMPGTAQHGGGGSWTSLALDASAGEVFIPVGNPWPDFAPTDRPGANLYTDSVVVLNALTGALKWYYQLAPHDGHDLDLGAAPVLFLNAAQHRMVAAAGKDGYVHVVDRETHALAYKTPVTTLLNMDRKLGSVPTKVCPGPLGGTEWNGPAFDPAHRLLVVGAVDMCMTETSAPGAKYVPGQMSLGGGVAALRDPPNGWITAINADTGKVVWRYEAHSPVVAGVVATAGGLVFSGDNAGNFLALEAGTGKVLKTLPAGGAMAGGVITYAIGGRQYVAFMAGNVSRTMFGAAGSPSLVVLRADKAAEAAWAPDAGRGETAFLVNCSGCHGGDGAGIAGFDLKGIGKRKTRAELVAWIENPTPPMPRVFGNPPESEERREIEDIVAYLTEKF